MFSGFGLTSLSLREKWGAVMRSGGHVFPGLSAAFLNGGLRRIELASPAFGLDWFWSGCAAAMKKGFEILGISIVDADAKDSVFLKAEYFGDNHLGISVGQGTGT